VFLILILGHPNVMHLLLLMMLQCRWPIAAEFLNRARYAFVTRLQLQLPDILQGHLVLAQGGDALDEETAAGGAALPAQFGARCGWSGGLIRSPQPIGLVQGTHGTAALQRETRIDGFARIMFDFHYERKISLDQLQRRDSFVFGSTSV